MAEELAPGVFLLDVGWRPPLASKAFLADDGDLTLIDAGLPVNFPGLRSEIRATGREVEDIDRVLLTHYDLDHVGGLARLVPDLDAPVYVGRADLDVIRGEGDVPLVHHKGLFHRVSRVVHSLPDSLEMHPVHDGDRIGGFDAFHTPGHNPGHVAYVHEELSAAFLGDLVWSDGEELTIPVRFDSYDVDQISESVRRFAADAPDFEVACTAHGPPIETNGREAVRDLATRLADGRETANWFF